jgi:hypothetical protein
VCKEEMSSIVSLEIFSVGFAGFCCIFYGLLGISMICTSNCENSYIADSGASLKLTPAIASVYCSVAFITGYILWMLRDTVGVIVEGISTFGSSLGKQTVEGQEMQTFSTRFAVILTLVFVIVVVFMRLVLLGPLEKCESLDPEQAPFMFAARSTLKRMEIWVVGLGFVMLFSGLVISLVEKWYREGYKKRERQGEDPEDYKWSTAVHDKYKQTRGYWKGENEGTLKNSERNHLEESGSNHPAGVTPPHPAGHPNGPQGPEVDHLPHTSPHPSTSPYQPTQQPHMSHPFMYPPHPFMDPRAHPYYQGQSPHLIGQPHPGLAQPHWGQPTPPHVGAPNPGFFHQSPHGSDPHHHTSAGSNASTGSSNTASTGSSNTASTASKASTMTSSQKTASIGSKASKTIGSKKTASIGSKASRSR